MRIMPQGFANPLAVQSRAKPLMLWWWDEKETDWMTKGRWAPRTDARGARDPAAVQRAVAPASSWLSLRFLRCPALCAVLLRKPLHAAFGVEQLLLAGEERVAVRADFQVQLGFG
jgi:hypothetical protein